MKRTRITSIASCLIVISQLFSFNFSANNFENISTDMTAEEPVLTTETAEKITDTTEKKVSAYVTENELWTAYETFNEFTRKNDLKVIFDFESFKEEYYSLGYNGIEEYLNALYNVFDLRQESDSAQQAETHTADSIDTSDSYRDGLAYSDEILDAYEKMVISLESENIPVELCLEDFEYNYINSEENNISDYCEKVILECKSDSAALDTEKIDIYSSSSSGDLEYYYDIGTNPTTRPNYSKYNILQLAQKGDIILDNEGSGGVFGHAGIVEGSFYSSTYSCYYVRLIESIEVGVSRGLWDVGRTDDRDTYLYKVYTATPEQKAKAVDFCIGQLGKPWELNLTHNYSESSSKWMCSQLVWTSYKNQGVDIEMDGGPGGEPGVTPHDITENSTQVTHVDFRQALNTVPNGTYYLTNFKSGRRLDIRGGTSAQSAQVQQYDAGVYNEQKWRFTFNSTGRYYTISSDITSNGTFYLDVASPSSGSHAKVKLWNAKTNPEERWFIQKDSGNTYRFINGYSGLCMDITGGSIDNKADVQVYPYIGADDQRWMLSRCGYKVLDNGTYYITNLKSGLRLDIRGGVPGQSVQVQQYQAGDYPEQKWVLEWNPTWSCYHIRSNIVSGGIFYLDVASPSSGSHAKVKLWNECTRPEERWTLIQNSNGTYTFINGYDGLCMDIMGGSTENKADVQVYPFISATDQMWKFAKAS